MKPAIIDRIVAIKDQMLADLDQIKGAHQLSSERLMHAVTSKTDELRETIIELTRAVEEQTGKVNWQLSSAANTLKDMREVLYEYSVPTQDPYSYSAQMIGYRFENPELSLLQHIRSFLPSRNVVDIGAHAGNATELLLSAGFKVFAFEPNEKVHKKLAQRFDKNPDFKSFPIAVGESDGHGTMFSVKTSDDVAAFYEKDLSVYGTLVKHALPDGAWFHNPTEVQMQSLKSLHQSRQIPLEISIVKIDIEGGDLQAIRGMGKTIYPCIVTKFWDKKFRFSEGTAPLLQDIVAEMRKRGNNWHIVMYRVVEGEATTDPRFYANLDQSVEGSWGNVLFFRDFSLFSEALKWCSANLRQNETFR